MTLWTCCLSSLLLLNPRLIPCGFLLSLVHRVSERKEGERGPFCRFLNGWPLKMRVVRACAFRVDRAVAQAGMFRLDRGDV